MLAGFIFGSGTKHKKLCHAQVEVFDNEIINEMKDFYIAYEMGKRRIKNLTFLRKKANIYPFCPPRAEALTNGHGNKNTNFAADHWNSTHCNG